VKAKRSVDFIETDAAAFEHFLRLRHADRQPRLAVTHERLDLGAAVGHVQRAHHAAEARDGQVADDEIRSVWKLHRDYVAARYAALLQAVRGAKDAVLQLRPVQNLILKNQRRRFGSLHDMARKPLLERVIRPPAARNVFAFHYRRILIAWTKR
jgi:hypothetical protein